MKAGDLVQHLHADGMMLITNINPSSCTGWILVGTGPWSISQRRETKYTWPMYNAEMVGSSQAKEIRKKIKLIDD